jgi:hypothetical protein
MSSPARAARRHGPRTRRDVVIGYCRPDMVDGAFFDAVSLMLFHDRDADQRILATIGVEGGPRLGRSRCEVVKTFLQTEAEWLCWLDTDMTPPADMIDRLLEHADPEHAPVVGALCFAGGRTKIVPTIYVIHNEDGKLESETILSYPPNTLIEVGGTGSACLVIHRSVFERVLDLMGPDHPLPWYEDVIIENKDWGEDLVFCLRARAVGARVWIHTGVQVGHRKKWTIDERAFLSYAKKLDESVGGPVTFNAEDMPKIEILPEIVAV